MLDVKDADVAIEDHREVLGVAQAVLSRQRAGDAVGDVLGGHRPRQPRHDDLVQAAGIEPGEIIGPQRFDDARQLHGAGLTKVRRAKHRHIGGGAGVLDEVADAHDFRADRDQLPEPRRGGRGLGGGLETARGDHDEG
jgi:hypothetical protein